VFGALLATAILLTHGTELYTAAIGLVFVFVAGWRHVSWMRMLVHLSAAVVLAAGLAIPYLPALLDFYRGGGAVAAGTSELDSISTRVADLTGLAGMLHLVFDAVGAIIIDAPLRMCALLAGIIWTLRARTGRLLIALGLTFLGLAVAFDGLDVPAVKHVYALAFPWSQDYRLLTIVAICASLLGGAGLVMIGGWFTRPRRWPARPVGVLLAALLAQASIALLVQRLSAETTYYLTYSGDDEVALRWLGDNIWPGELVVNDGSADAGIWAPYKAGASILLPRALPVADLEKRVAVRRSLSQVDDIPQVLATACALGARYVYVGAAGTIYESREFPSVTVLEQSPALEEVFSHGAAAVFRIQCAAYDA
jgi:hypothetical protein